MGKYEVTRAQWNQVVAAAKLRFVDYNFDEALQSWPLVFSPNGSSIAGWPKAVVTPVSSSGRNPLDLGHATTNSTVSRSFTVTNLSGESLSFSIVSKGKPYYPLYFTQPAIGVSINGSTNNDVASINMDHNTSFTLTVNFRPPYTDPSWYRANVEIKARDRYNTQTLAQTLTFIGQCTGSQANTADVSQHPMHSLSYTDAAKYCNALSELNGLTPVYKWPILNSATNKLLLRYNEGISSATQSVYRSGLWNGESHITGSADPVPDLVNANGYRLPTKEEWEWAMRGGSASSSTTYSGSNDATEVAWHRNNSTGSALPLFSTGLTGASGLLVDDDIIKYYMVANVGTFSIGQKIPNALGIYDLHGNVAEIIQGTNNAAATQALGGAWDSAADALNNTRPIYQTLNDVGGRGTGLRVVRSGQPVIRSMAYTANGVTTTSASGQVGVEFTPVYPIAKNVRSYTATGLPAGLSISTTTGHISGTPLNSGFSGLTRNFTANITVENASGTSAVFPFPISIKPTAPVLTLPSTPPDFILNSAEKTYTPPATRPRNTPPPDSLRDSPSTPPPASSPAHPHPPEPSPSFSPPKTMVAQPRAHSASQSGKHPPHSINRNLPSGIFSPRLG
jgi:formylglycine-generating enzyme required for sulfatase activity